MGLLADFRISFDAELAVTAYRFAIEPAFVEYPRVPFRINGGPCAVPEDFSYASDTNTDWLSAAALMAMVEEKAAA